VTPVRLAPEVPDELIAAARWYEARRAGLGREFLDAIEALIPVIARGPRSFPRLADVGSRFENRRALLGRFPFAIVYLIGAEEIRILAVAHTRRDPGYWLNRLRP
jgi:plasmid stabilization system protein ParE